MVPRLIKKYFKERKIAYFLKEQVIILADSDRSKRWDANQKITTSLSNKLGCEAAIKWKIDRILIHYLTSNLDDTKRFAIENLERILNNSDYQKVVSSELIKRLIVNLSEDSEIRDQSKTLLHRIIINHFGKIFIDSIDSGISEFSIIMDLIELLQYSLETEENDVVIQEEGYSLLKSYLHSTDYRIKNQAMRVLENRINIRTSGIFSSIDIISQLLDLLTDNNCSNSAQRVLIVIGKSGLLPKIIQISRQNHESLPRQKLSCLIYETIASNDFSELIEIDVLTEIFEFLSDDDFQTKYCAADSLIRFLYICNNSERKKRILLQKLTDLNINRQITILLSSDNLDVFNYGLRIFKQLIRMFGKDTIVSSEIVNTLIHGCLHDSADIRYNAFKMIEDLEILPDIVVNYLCRLGLDENQQDRVADKLAAMIFGYKQIPILDLIDNFGVSLTANEKIKFEQLKQKIADQLKIMDGPDEQGLNRFSL